MVIAKGIKPKHLSYRYRYKHFCFMITFAKNIKSLDKKKLTICISRKNIKRKLI